MSDTKKTKAQLIEELKQLRQELSMLKNSPISKINTDFLYQKLQESETHFSMLMQQLPAVVEIYDLDGLQISVNRAYENLWGFPAETTVNKFNVLKSKEVVDTGLIEYVNRAYDGETVTVPEYEFDPKGKTESGGHGRNRWLSTKIFPLKDKSEKVTNIVITHEDITDRKEIEKKLSVIHESEKTQADIVRNAPLAIAFGYPDGRIDNCNKSFTELTGYSIEELKKIAWNEVLTPAKWRDHEADFLKKLTGENDVVSYEKEYIHKDGRVIPVELTVKPKFIKGELIHFIGFVKDITERKKAEKDLLNSEEKFRTMVTNNEEIIYMIDKDGIFRLSEGKGLAKIGVKPGQVLGNSVFELYADYPDMLNEMKKALNGNKVEIEHSIGDQHFKSWYTPQLDDEDEVIALLGLSVNITENKQLEKRLHQSKEQMDLALKGSDAGLWSWNIKTGEDYLDERWCGILGYKMSEIPQVVSSWESLVHPDDKERIMNVVSKHLEDDKNPYKDEYRMKCKDGSWKWILASGKIVERDDEGNPARMTGIIIDINERKKAEEELKVYRKDLEKLVKARTDELEIKNKKLDEAIKVFVGRELTIRNLQATIQNLKDSEKSKSR